MKHSDVVNQLRVVLPKYTDRFNNTLSISSISATTTTATVVTSVTHNQTTGAAVTFKDWQFENVITSVSQDGLVFTFETTTPHDLTEGYQETITLQGFTDTNWNGEFTLLEVTNSTTFKIQSTNSLPTLDVDSALVENLNTGLTGLFGITVIDTTTFTVSGTFKPGNYFNGGVASGVRVAAAVDIERAIELYTEKNLTDYWMFVICHDSDISKSLDTGSDANAVFNASANMRMKLMNNFTIFVICNCSDQPAAVVTADICRSDILYGVLRSVLGVKFDTYLSQVAQYKTTFDSHGMSIYDGARYVHFYAFQSVSEVTNEDAVNVDDSVAFREIDYIKHVDGTLEDTDVETMTVTIPLDDEPVIP